MPKKRTEPYTDGELLAGALRRLAALLKRDPELTEDERTGISRQVAEIVHQLTDLLGMKPGNVRR